ncbi:MAG: hypothetical protein C5B53_08925 [Candidatus Melainabacteria bacterium]|nr:MAG: hypothetical protein C5B53_08925 [Candidatus Melainabacteria bacterium]
MSFSNADIFLGQMWRRATHVRRFRRACRQPLQSQTEKLLSIVSANQNTAFGKAHNFHKIKSIADFRQYVPPCQYEDLQPYIDALLQGQQNQLTAEEPFMFATTSGTTAKPKFIPITETHLRDYTHAFQIHNYHLIQDNYQAAFGRFLILTSNDEEGRAPCGLPYGAVSGLLNRRQSPIIRRHFAIPYEMCKIKDVDVKYYLVLRTALAQNVTAVLACNPSSLLLLSAQLGEHASDLVSDIFDGTVKSRYAPPRYLAAAFSSFLGANREKARQLEKLLNQEGVLSPKTVWPNLSVLSCWKGGPMSFYLDKLSDHYGPVPVRDFGYMASEGRGSIPLGDQGAGGVLAVNSHFFEFVEEAGMDDREPRFLTADELSLGRRYYIFFTTSAGLYRYNINDLIEVVGFENKTPIIAFVRKGLGISSITGEKITEEQVLTAIKQVARQLNLLAISHFTAEVALGMPPHYVCFAELNSALPQSVQDEFIRLFDHSLRMQNPEYEDKRSSRRLGMPSLRILPPGTYTRLRQQRVLEGAPEAQVKIPLLSTSQMFSGQLALLGVEG